MTQPPRTIRVFWNNVSTGWHNFNWDGVIFGNSVVQISICVSICESTPPVAGVPVSIGGPGNMERKRGDAVLSVKNVRPHFPNPGDPITGGVEFYIENTFGQPLPAAIDITVFDFPDQVAYAG